MTARDLVLWGQRRSACTHFLTWFESLSCTSVASSTVLVSTEVIFTAWASPCSCMENPTAGGVGHSPGLWGQRPAGPLRRRRGRELSGNLLALAAASAAAVYTLIGRIQRGHLSTTVYTFLTYLACFLTLLLGTAAAGTPLTGYGGREWLIGLALAVLCISWDTACLAGASSTCPHPTCPPQAV